MQRRLIGLTIVLWLLGATVGCTKSPGAKDLADELDEALDPAPQYVDQPADEPAEPK